MLINVLRRGVVETGRSDKPVHDGIGVAKRRAQSREHVAAVDVQALPGERPAALEMAQDERGGFSLLSVPALDAAGVDAGRAPGLSRARDRGRKAELELTQRGHLRARS